MMGRPCSSGVVWLVVVAAALVAMGIDCGSDEDPLQDFCIADVGSWTHVNGYPCRDPARTTSEEFVYRNNRRGGDPTRTLFGAALKDSFVQDWPALNAQGVSWSRIDFRPGGMNVPHWHPSASEILYCQTGTLLSGFIQPRTNRLFSSILYPGDLFVFPRAAVHFQLNIGRGPAMAHAAFNHQNPSRPEVGYSTFASRPTTIPNSVLRKAFDLGDDSIQHLKQFFSREQWPSEFFSASDFPSFLNASESFPNVRRI